MRSWFAAPSAIIRRVALIGLICVPGCSSASPALPSATGSGPALPDACAIIDLRTPSGASVDLSGRWRAPSGGTFYVRQAGSCVWFVGISPEADEADELDLAPWVNSYFGTLSPDFTLSGSWADLVRVEGLTPIEVGTNAGDLDWRLNFADIGGEEATTLEVIDMVGGFGDSYLVRPATDGHLSVRLRDTDGDCLAAVADQGEEYELASLPPGWVIATPRSLYGPDGEVIRLSDTFGVQGEVALGTGSCGPGRLVFVDQIEADQEP